MIYEVKVCDVSKEKKEELLETELDKIQTGMCTTENKENEVQ